METESFGDNEIVRRWGFEHVSKEDCAIRAEKLAPAIGAMFRPHLAEYMTTTATLLNAPVHFQGHAIVPLFGSVARYTKVARWHASNGKGHMEPLNFTKTLGCESGSGNSQTMRAFLSEFDLYGRTTKRDIVARNVTIESLEARMYTNANLEEPIPGVVVPVDSARQGGALVPYDEGNKLVCMGQYSNGKSDFRERWMEASVLLPRIEHTHEPC